MAFQVDEYGNITLIQGDTGILVISGIDKEKNYKVYFSVTDEKRNRIGNEISVSTNKQGSVLIYLTGDFTNLLTVNKKDEAAIYYYGIKLCDEENNIEDTLIPSGCEIGEKSTITVFPKKVEGI